MKAEIVNVKGLTFVGKGSTNHWTVMDGPEKFQGSDAGPRPLELFLMGLGGCTGSDVKSLLAKMREPVQSFSMELTAEQAEEHPRVFTSVHIKYKLVGKGIKPESVEKAIQLSADKYCPARAMLAPTVPITHSYEITEE